MRKKWDVIKIINNTIVFLPELFKSKLFYVSSKSTKESVIKNKIEGINYPHVLQNDDLKLKHFILAVRRSFH